MVLTPAGVFRDMGEVNISKNIQDIFAKYDTDGNGEIDYNEFVDGTLAYVEENRTLLENERSVEKVWNIPYIIYFSIVCDKVSGTA